MRRRVAAGGKFTELAHGPRTRHYDPRVLSVRGLTKIYSGRPVVDNVSFDLRPGTVTAFLGPNGAGKHTTH